MMQYMQIISFMLCLLTFCGCQNSEDVELAKAKAEAEAAKEELANMQAKVEEKSHNCAVTGELFVTTQSGDVKKAAGIGVRLIAITKEFRTKMTELKKKLRSLSEKQYAVLKPWESQNPRPKYTNSSDEERDRWESARNKVIAQFQPQFAKLFSEFNELLSKTTYNTTTNSDGKFQIEAKKGDYFLISETFSTGFDKLVWYKLIKVQGKDLTLSLNQESAVLGFRIGRESFGPSSLDIRESVFEQLDQ